MADRAVGVAEAGVPTVLIDNEAVTNDGGQAVVRQRIASPDATGLLSEAVYLLRLIAGVAPAREPATQAARVAVQGTVPVSGSLTTVSTVTTLTTMSNQTNFGGLPAQNQQFGHGAEASAFLVQRAVSGLWRSRGKAVQASIFRLRCPATSCLPLRLAALRRVLAMTPTKSS